MNHNSTTTSYHSPRLITKLAEKVVELDDLHAKINEVYSQGAVEGYTDEYLGSILQKKSFDSPVNPNFKAKTPMTHTTYTLPRQEKDLMVLHKRAMRS